MLEHDTAQQTVGGDGGAPKIQGALAAARQRPRANGDQLRIFEQEINLAEGRVLQAAEFFEESKTRTVKPGAEGVRSLPNRYTRLYNKAATLVF